MSFFTWDQKDLAHHSGVSLPTIKRLETQPGTLSAYHDTRSSIRKALESAGIEFINGDAPGVRLWRKKGAKRMGR
jgi:hypothetical protein